MSSIAPGTPQTVPDFGPIPHDAPPAAYAAVARRVAACWDRGDYAKAKKIARRARATADQATPFGAMIGQLAAEAERRCFAAEGNHMLTLETAICSVIDNPADMETVALELMRQGHREPMPGTIIKSARKVGVSVR